MNKLIADSLNKAFGLFLGIHRPYCLLLYRMKTKQYQITITVATIQRPKDIVWYVTRKLKDVMPTIGIEINEIVDRLN